VCGLPSGMSEAMTEGFGAARKSFSS
jgi:hypothetical protein